MAEFLNRLGVRWLMPTEFGEVGPKLKTIEFEDGPPRLGPGQPVGCSTARCPSGTIHRRRLLLQRLSLGLGE